MTIFTKKLFNKLLLAVASVLFLSSIAPAGVLAQLNSEGAFYNNGILFFDPNAAPNSPQYGSCGDANIDYDVAEGESNLHVAWQYFLAKGLTEGMAAGIIGNLRHESGQSSEDYIIIYPNITQNAGFDAPFNANDNRGYGIAQWTYPTRKERLQTFSEAHYGPIDDLEFGENLIMQLDFIWFELTGDPPTEGVTGGQASTAYSNLVGLVTDDPNVDNAPDYEKASYIFHMDYENDDQAITYRGIANPTYEDYLTAHDHRNMLSEDTYNRLTGTSGGSLGCYANTSGIINTVLSYAWPDNRGRGYTIMKPEYEVAVNEARARGEWLGGCSGVDCGGFVTRAVRDSGLDPNYNSSMCNTTCQYNYVSNPVNGWQPITITSTADLQPGDVAVWTDAQAGTRNGHTFVYIGEQPGFEYVTASASVCSRSPMAYPENVLGPNANWFRRM